MTDAAVPVMRVMGQVERPVGSTVDLDEVRARRQRVGGEHLWVTKLVHRVDDPATALDELCLDETNLVGVEPIHCLWCEQRYLSPIQPDPACHPAGISGGRR